jgi:two-component system sensor histidine kinase/response regulator
MVRTVDLAVEGYTFLAFEELQREGIPLQRQLVKELDSLIQIQRDMTRKAAEAARTDYLRTRWLMIGLGVVALLAAALVAATVMRRTARLAAATERERTKFMTLFETNTDGIVILDRRGFTDCNPATLEMFHMTRVEDFLKLRPEDLGVEDQPCGTPANILAARHIQEAVDKGHAFFHWTARRPDGGTFPAEIALHAMNLDGKPVIQAIMRDISARKEVESALEAARDAALMAAEMKSQFVANVSHEIRTPMNGILGMTQLLLKSPLNPRQLDYAQSIATSAQALMGVINDLLDFSKIEAGRLTLESIEFDLAALLKEVIELYVPRADARNLALRLERNEALPAWVRGDPLRVRQVLLNLLDNAIKFTHEGEVRLIVEPDADRQGWLRFAVRDSGIGMSEEIPGAHFPGLFPGRRLGQPQVRRHRPGPGHLPATGGIDGRRTEPGERARTRQHLPAHAAPARRPGPRPRPGRGAAGRAALPRRDRAGGGRQPGQPETHPLHAGRPGRDGAAGR